MKLLRKPQHALLLGLFCLLFGMSASAQGISVQLDGRTLYFDQPPAMIQGRLLVPLRGIFEALNADVVYDAPTRSIQATKGPTVVQLQLGSRTALIDGRTTYLDVPADTVGGRTMVPLRFVSEALGADVKWNGATKTVMIMSGTGNTTPSNNNNNNNNGNNTSEAGAPKIDRIVHNGTDVLAPGDALEVIVYGDPGAKATFEILGQTQEQNLPEVSSGRYQTRYVIPSGLTVEKGVLLAHLTKNGRETAQESDRQVTVRTNGNNNSSNSNNWSTYPQSNDNISVSRPQFTVNFPESVQQNTVRLYIDGVDFSRQARMNGNQLTWTPQYDLPNGQHKAQARATAASGRTLDYQWNFNVNTSSNNNNNGSFAVQELRPSSNQNTNSSRPQIGAIFNSNINANNVTLVVDNINVTNQQGAQKYSNGIMWTPPYNLQNGSHSATVTAVDQNNRQVSQSWNFQINGNNSNNNNSNNSAQNLSVTNISNGITLPAVFNVQGNTQPGRQVTALIEYTPNNLLEVLTGQTRQITKTALANGNGHFDIPVDASAVSPNQNFRITVSDGGASPSQVYTVRRQ